MWALPLRLVPKASCLGKLAGEELERVALLGELAGEELERVVLPGVSSPEELTGEELDLERVTLFADERGADSVSVWAERANQGMRFDEQKKNIGWVFF